MHARTAASSKRPAGFTLIEALVALVIASLVTGLALALLQSLLRVRGWTEHHKEDGALAQALLDLLAADLRQAVSGDQGISVAVPLRCVVEENGTWHLELLTLSGFASGEGLPAGLYNVRYRYRPKEGVLERQQAALREPEEAPWMPLAEGVIGFAVQFHDGTRWLDRWPPAGRSRLLPVAVRIELALRSGNQPRQESRLVLLAAR